MPSGHISLMLAFAFALPACGGSASETPPPLEPDLSLVPKGPPASGRYVVVTPRTKRDAKDEEQAAPEQNGDAPSTWGDPSTNE